MASSKSPTTSTFTTESTRPYCGMYLRFQPSLQGERPFTSLPVKDGMVEGLIVSEGGKAAFLVRGPSNKGLTHEICLKHLEKMIKMFFEMMSLNETDIISKKRIASFDVADFFNTEDMGMVWKLVHAKSYEVDCCYISNSEICSNHGKLDIFFGTIGLSSLIPDFKKGGITTIGQLKALDDDVLRKKFDIKICPIRRIKRHLSYLKEDSEVWKNVWLDCEGSLSPDVRKLAVLTGIGGL